MTRKIILTTQETKPPTPAWKQELPTNAACQVYPRVSSPEQKKNVSAEMQQDKGFAIICGWADDQIIMDTEDLGLSGQLKMEERPAFVKMLRHIANGEVKTVIAAQVDRLFRDRWGAEYSKFMEICYLHGVKVVTPNPWRTGIDFVYDFAIPWHVEKFRRKCEEAWSYLENHVYGRMLAAARELWESGHWSGGSLPLGYLVDRREKVDGKRNPHYRKYIIYEPHARVVRWLFERYREMAGQINALLREIERRPVLFPAFDASVDEELVASCANKKIFDEDGKLIGYTIASDRGLRGLLSNPAYVGYWLFSNAVISTDNHDAIVEDYGAFLYAYNRLSAWHLDGTPNEAFLEKRQRYVKKHKADKPALLKNHLVSGDSTCAVHPVESPRKPDDGQGEKVAILYGFYPRGGRLRLGSNYLIPAADIDGFFLERFIERLQNANGFEHFLDQDRTEQQAQLQLQEDISRDIQAAEAHMKRIEKQVANGELTNPELLKIANTTYNALQEDVARLRARLQEVTTNGSHAQKRRTYKQLLQEAGERWDEVVDFDVLLLMLETFVEKVVLTALTPHFYTMALHWLDPEWGIDEALCFRGGNPSLRWSAKEDELLKLHYASMSREELLQIIPTRSMRAMIQRARTFGLERRVSELTDVPRHLSWHEFQLMGQGWTDVQIQARRDGKRPRWTQQEDDQLLLHWPSAPRNIVLEAIPERSYEHISCRAKALRITRRGHEWETTSYVFCWQDLQLMQEYGLTEDLRTDKRGGGTLIRWRCESRPLGENRA